MRCGTPTNNNNNNQQDQKGCGILDESAFGIFASRNSFGLIPDCRVRLGGR